MGQRANRKRLRHRPNRRPRTDMAAFPVGTPQYQQPIRPTAPSTTFFPKQAPSEPPLQTWASMTPAMMATAMRYGSGYEAAYAPCSAAGYQHSYQYSSSFPVGNDGVRDRMSVDAGPSKASCYSFATTTPLAQVQGQRTSTPSSFSSRKSRDRENALSRDLRVFGGELEDDDLLNCSGTAATALSPGGDSTSTVKSSVDLRGAMLDVVLGLFNGIDYDDEAC